jgi:NADPH-dependent 2,4-dienoyl-CoA reductase/sulfur reductase-like enzyme
MFLGLRTVIYPTADLAASKDVATRLLGTEPYFDQPFYVGYDVAGYEFALDPNADLAAGPTTYWGVADVDAAVVEMSRVGASIRSAVSDVGDQIRVATMDVPGIGVLGLIENPHFHLPPTTSTGPGQ